MPEIVADPISPPCNRLFLNLESRSLNSLSLIASRLARPRARARQDPVPGTDERTALPLPRKGTPGNSENSEKGHCGL